MHTWTPCCPRKYTNHYYLDSQKASYSRVEQINWEISFDALADIPIGIHNGFHSGPRVIGDSKCANPKRELVLADYVKETGKSRKEIVCYAHQSGDSLRKLTGFAGMERSGSIVIVVEFCETVLPLLQDTRIKVIYLRLWPVAAKLSCEGDLMKGLAVC
jgi:hypothetical protein